MKYLLSIDAGKSTGCALFKYEDETPAELVSAWQFGGGIAGFLEWWRDHTYEYMEGPEVFIPNVDDEPNATIYPGISGQFEIGSPRLGWREHVTIVSERFVPLTGNGFAHTSDSIEPVRIEGAMIALGMMPADYSDKRWQRAGEMYWVPGKNATEKRRNQVAWVKERFPELHLAGKNVNAPDADDARSALWHGMVWLRKHHKPSAERWFGND